MAGYRGYSMSNNAVLAYESSERPRSKWTKTDIVRELSKDIPPEKMSLIRKLPADTLRRLCLKKTSWHHTSARYNVTDFYMVDPDGIRGFTDTELISLASKPKKAPERPVERTAVYLEWSGTRKHPKAIEVQARGIVKGDWFHLPDGSKKSVYAKGFRFID